MARGAGALQLAGVIDFDSVIDQGLGYRLANYRTDDLTRRTSRRIGQNGDVVGRLFLEEKHVQRCVAIPQ